MFLSILWAAEKHQMYGNKLKARYNFMNRLILFWLVKFFGIFLGAQTDIPVSKMLWLQPCKFETESKYKTSLSLEREKLIYFKE